MLRDRTITPSNCINAGKCFFNRKNSKVLILRTVNGQNQACEMKVDKIFHNWIALEALFNFIRLNFLQKPNKINFLKNNVINFLVKDRKYLLKTLIQFLWLLIWFFEIQLFVVKNGNKYGSLAHFVQTLSKFTGCTGLKNHWHKFQLLTCALLLSQLSMKMSRN